MKAVVMDRYGTPDLLEIRDVPTPTPKANELLVRVFAATNRRLLAAPPGH